MKIENEHITSIHEGSQDNEEGDLKDKETHKKEVAKINHGADSNHSEIAYAASSLPEKDIINHKIIQSNHHEEQESFPTITSLTFKQEHLLDEKERNKMLQEIEENKEFKKNYVKEEDMSQEDTIMLGVAMDMSHITKNKNCIYFINNYYYRISTTK